jgi:hypothetical protein
MPGDRDTECEIHRQFASHKIQREWFKPATDIIEFIERSCAKTERNIVECLNGRECRIWFARPLRANCGSLLMLGTHNMRVWADEELDVILGIEGRIELIEDYLSSVGVSSEALQEFRAALGSQS